MESSKYGRPYIWGQGSRVQDHVTMNAWVLNNLMAWFHCNEQKVIIRPMKHTTLEWNKFQGDLQYTLEVLKPTLVKLTSSLILQLLNMTTWGVGAMLLNVEAKLERNENLALVIQMIQVGYEKALKGA